MLACSSSRYRIWIINAGRRSPPARISISQSRDAQGSSRTTFSQSLFSGQSEPQYDHVHWNAFIWFSLYKITASNYNHFSLYRNARSYYCSRVATLLRRKSHRNFKSKRKVRIYYIIFFEKSLKKAAFINFWKLQKKCVFWNSKDSFPSF